ncbi:hypothetical protein D8674_001355 [Pyrus ussuriensis x Pyrus communis]|uniref:Uncharacterized protein n=1 Tax=Pyrus ussuriensis x Pyrus communis TaxID=2448454 RepID=A0A5N5F603_9ROSA|nr:hypothetical protein D8674_001355 [Pyrus ussuriensis x Pyrus communis]
MREIRSIHGDRELGHLKKWRLGFQFQETVVFNFGAFMCNLGTTLCSRYIKGDVTLRFLGLLCEAFEALCAQVMV